MTKLTNYGFIILGNSYIPQTHKAIIESKDFKSTVICADNLDQAIIVAKEMVHTGIQVIELCGGFGQSGALKIINEINCKIPVGYVTFPGYEHDKLTDFLVAD